MNILSANNLLSFRHSTTRLDDHPAKTKLFDFAGLPVGWDNGRGTPISSDVLQRAELVLSIGLLLNFEANTFPGSNNEVAVIFYKATECVEVIVGTTPLVEAFREEGAGLRSTVTEHEENLSLSALFKLLTDWGHSRPWNSPASSAADNSTSLTGGFLTSPSNLLVGLVPELQTGSVASRS
jgi:hypothetical protein